MFVDDGAFFSLIFYLLYGGAVLFPFVVRRTQPKLVDPFDPYLVLSLLLFFYTISTLRSFEATGLAATLESVSSLSVSKYALACLIGQCGLAAGELAASKNSWRPGRVSQSNSSLAELSLLTGPGLAFAMILLPFYFERFNFFGVVSYADSAFESRIDRALDQAAGVKDVFLREIPASLLLSGATVLLFDRSKPIWLRTVGGSAIAAYALTALLAGARGTLITTLLLPVLVYHYRIRSLSPVVVASLAIVGYLMVNILSIARISSNPAEMLQAVQEQIGLEGYSFLEVGESGELRTSTNLVRLIVGIDTGEDRFRWGEVLWSNIASSVPRTLWPLRPLTGAELFTQVFYPGTLEAGGGYGSFIFQDPYWDFGFAGVFAFAAVLMWGIRKLYTELLFTRQSSFYVLLYAILYGAMVISVVRGGIFAGIKGALVPMIPFFAIAVIVRFAPPRVGELHNNRSE